MPRVKRNILVFAILLTSLLLGIQAVDAAPTPCADGDIDACWARFYVPGGGKGEAESRVYFRIFRACPDGLRIGIAANLADDYSIYIKQYGSGEVPPFRLLTEVTNVTLDPYPAGVEIEFTGETALSYDGTTTVYFMKIFNVAWSEVFDSDYMDGVMIASPGYGYNEDDSTGIVRAGSFGHCYTFNPPNESYITPFVQCVIVGQDNSFSAVFGYTSRPRIDSLIPYGPNNFHTIALSAPIKGHVPTLFEPATHNNVFRLTALGPPLFWQVNGVTATATLASPRCRIEGGG